MSDYGSDSDGEYAEPTTTATTTSSDSPTSAEPNVSIKRALSAFEYFRAATIPSIQAATPNLSVGQLTSAVSAQWQSLDATKKKKFLTAAASDKARFQSESAAADDKYEEEQRARRENLVAKENEAVTGRAGRGKADAERAGE